MNGDKAKRYATIKYATAIADVAGLLLFLAVFQIFGISVWLRSAATSFFAHRWAALFIYCLFAIAIYSILDLPLTFCRSYLVEHRFNLSNQNVRSWFSDYLKGLMLSTVIFLILIEAFSYFLKGYPHQWWWMSGIFWIFLSVVLARVFPVIIIPLFFKYTRLNNDDLRRRILELAARMKIKVLDVFQIDFSKKTVKANAALVGLGRTKRVILADTLEGKFSPEEVEVILAHEFAHYRLKHLVKGIILNAAIILFIFYIFFRFGHFVFEMFGLDISDIAGLPIWLFLFTVYQIVLTPLLNWITRIMERNADRMAIAVTGKRGEFISMIEKLTEQNLSERKPPLWIKIFFYDHPTAEERVAMASQIEPRIPNPESRYPRS